MEYNKELLIALREKAKIGSKTMQLLLANFKSLEGIISADTGQLTAIPRISENKARTIQELENHLGAINNDLELYAEAGINVLTIFDDNYPALLKEIPDPPFVLYYKGHFPLSEDDTYVAMVGTTQASAEGIDLAVNYSRAMAEKGVVIVSGLARGIDTASHMGAIKAQGRSYAVLGSGLNQIYPPENDRLSEELMEKGALISEYPPETSVNTGRLLSRNRIIVGLAHSLVVCEIDKKSRGTINAAERAMDMGKLMFAVGDKSSPIDPGLIEYGAIPMEDIKKADLITDHSF